MSKAIFEALNPNNQSEVLWAPDQDGFVYPESVLQVSQEFNNVDYQVLVNQVGARVNRDRDTGIEYGEWRKPNDSETDAVVMFSTFATRIDRNMSLRGEFCNRVLRIAGITDPEGRSLPLYFMAAPAGNARYPLGRDQRRQIAGGNLGPAAEVQMKLIKEKGFGRQALIGFSQGGSMAAAGARVASSMNIDVTTVGAASVPNVTERAALGLQLAFAGQARHLRPDLDKGGLIPFQQVHEEDYSEIAYSKAMLSQLKLNWALFKGMTHDQFGADLETAIQQFPDLKTTMSVATGEGDHVGIESATRATLEELRHEATKVGAPTPHFISIKEGHHSWGDRIKVLSSFYAYALSRALGPDEASLS